MASGFMWCVRSSDRRLSVPTDEFDDGEHDECLRMYRATVHDRRTAPLRGLRPKLRESLNRFSPYNIIDLCHSRRAFGRRWRWRGGERTSGGELSDHDDNDDWHRSCRAYLRTKHHPAAFNRATRPDSYANPDTKILSSTMPCTLDWICGG